MRRSGLQGRCQRYLQVTSSLKDDSGRFRTSDVVDGLAAAFVVIGKLAYLSRISDRPGRQRDCGDRTDRAVPVLP